MSNSTASSEGNARSAGSSATASTSDGQATSAAAVCRYHGTMRRRAAVTTPSVPSLPTSNWASGTPAVCLGRPWRSVITEPSARTACTPATWARMVPKRTTREPPALVLTAPPTVALARAPQSTAKSSPAARACSCSRSMVTPAPAVTCWAATSTGPSASSRRSDSNTSPARGTLPPTSPVLPPCGTIAAPATAQARTTAATSSTDPGRTTQRDGAPHWCSQSVSYPARTSASSRT